MTIYEGEGQLQAAFINWYIQEEGYHERFDDVHSEKSTSIDSAGFINEQPVLIEIKRKLSAGEAKDIEQKINAVLRALYGIEHRNNQEIADALSDWNRSSVPHIIIVVHKISKKAIDALKTLLAHRAQEWQFNCTLWVWKNEHEHEKVLHLNRFKAYAHAGVFPPIPASSHKTTSKHSTSQLEELAALAAHNGVSELFEAMLIRIRQVHGKPEKRKSNINYKLPIHDATPSGGKVGLWPGESSAARGLLVTYTPTLFQNLPDETNLPGILAESRVGWLGKSRWLRTVEEVNLFWDIVVSNKA